MSVDLEPRPLDPRLLDAFCLRGLNVAAAYALSERLLRAERVRAQVEPRTLVRYFEPTTVTVR